jgi:hypothetical protein
MAYKFQLGLSSLSGSLIQTGSFTVVDDNKVNRFTIDRDTGDVSGSGLTQLADIRSNVAIAATGSITAGTSFIIGSADLNEVDMEKLDGITNGTAAANKALVADANIDIASLRNVTATGAITAGTSFIIGSADLNETDMEKLDGITNGTAAASKAVVLDASKNIATLGTVGCGAITSTGGSTFASMQVSDLTDNRLVIAGGSGELEDNAKLTFDGADLALGASTRILAVDYSGSGTFQGAGAATLGSTLSVSGASTLNAVAATSYSGSSTFLAQGAATFGGLMNVSGNMQVDGTVVNFPNVGAAAMDAADLVLSLDSTSKDLQARTRTNVVSDMAGTAATSALKAASGVLSLDIDSLVAEVIATGDTLAFNDDGDNGLHKVTFDNMITKSPALLTEAAITVADDYMLFLDGGASGDAKKEKWADIVTAMAGAGLTATDGVLSSEAASTPVNLGDAAGRLVEGFNYSSVDFTAARIWITPASPSAGDKVIVKAPANADTYTLRVSGGEGSKIDGSTSVYMTSPSGSVTLTYLGSDSWSIS